MLKRVALAGSRGRGRVVAMAVGVLLLQLPGVVSSTAIRGVAATQVCATPGSDGPPAAPLTGIVNTYFAGTAGAAPGATSISVGAARPPANPPIAAGDLLLVVQVQDATIDSTNTDAYGDGVAGDPASGATSLGGSGQYEYVVATGPVTAGVVPIAGAGAGGLLNAYTASPTTADASQHKFQVVRVPQYSSASLSSGLTAAAWDGATGGILAIDVAGALNLGSATVSIDGLGFRGGAGRQLNGVTTGAANTDYVHSAPTTAIAGDPQAGVHGSKGEGVVGTPRWLADPAGATTLDYGTDALPGGSFARGAPGNAGGGGTDGDVTLNQMNSGGGGGANGGDGGLGGTPGATTWTAAASGAGRWHPPPRAGCWAGAAARERRTTTQASRRRAPAPRGAGWRCCGWAA